MLSEEQAICPEVVTLVSDHHIVVAPSPFVLVVTCYVTSRRDCIATAWFPIFWSIVLKVIGCLGLSFGVGILGNRSQGCQWQKILGCFASYGGEERKESFSYLPPEQEHYLCRKAWSKLICFLKTNLIFFCKNFQWWGGAFSIHKFSMKSNICNFSKKISDLLECTYIRISFFQYCY